MRRIILEKAAKITGSGNTGKLFYDKEILKGVQIESFVILVSFLSLGSVLFISLTIGGSLDFLELMSFYFVGFLVSLVLIFYGALSVFVVIFWREFWRKINREEYREAVEEANAALFCVCMMPIVGSYIFAPVRNRFQKWL